MQSCLSSKHMQQMLSEPYIHKRAHLRKLLKEAVLATDMGVHAEFMGRLQSVVRGEQMSLCARQVVLCQALLKNADISNPVGGFWFLSCFLVGLSFG